jgi:hypothetical protein
VEQYAAWEHLYDVPQARRGGPTAYFLLLLALALAFQLVLLQVID